MKNAITLTTVGLIMLVAVGTAGVCKLYVRALRAEAERSVYQDGYEKVLELVRKSQENFDTFHTATRSIMASEHRSDTMQRYRIFRLTKRMASDPNPKFRDAVLNDFEQSLLHDIWASFDDAWRSRVLAAAPAVVGGTVDYFSAWKVAENRVEDVDR